MIAAKLRQLASYAARGRGSVRGMDETKQRMAETRGLRGAEAAAVLRFGLGEGAEPQSEGFGERSIRRTPLSTADAGASEWRSARAAAAGGITLAVLVAAGVGFPQSGTESLYADVAHGSVSGPAVSAAGGSAGHRVGVTHKGSEQMSVLRNSVKASVVAGAVLVAASAGAQSAAVQWKVSEGGDGHWYQLVVDAAGLTWPTARQRAQAIGGDLAVCSGPGSTEFVQSLFSTTVCGGSTGQAGPYVGGFQDLAASDYSEPAGGWRWVDGSPFPGSAVISLDDNLGHQDYLHFISLQPSCGGPFVLDDVGTVANANRSFVVEWSADCNSDSIVDYGQCHDGTLADYNGNNISDCCEQGAVCVVENWPVQWRVEDGGNGHWYQVRQAGLVGWSRSRQLAEQSGGYLATLTTARESAFVASLITTNRGVNLGGYQDTSAPDFDEPGGGWRWVTGEPWTYTNWLVGEPNNEGANENCLMFAQTNAWGDKWADQSELCPACEPHYYVIEWSADCNHDNIVDYGQILLGQLDDTNTNGIPDICEGQTCRDVDLFRNGVINGADLGILLSEWGPASANTVSDINRDDRVDGSDLGTLLAFWGPCGG